MGNVPRSFQTRVHEAALSDVSSLPDAPEDRVRVLQDRSTQAILSLLKRYERLARILDNEVELGYPDDGAGTPRTSNVRLSWATASITNANQLGSGAGAPVTFTHNLGVPVTTVPTTGDDYPNVRWVAVCVQHGDRTGANAGPAATANAAHTSLHFLLGDTVTTNAIELRVHSDLTPSATEPITIDVAFAPAVI